MSLKTIKQKTMDILSKILEHYPDEGLLKADGFDDAIIGVSTSGRLVYSISKIIDILTSRNDNWSGKDAADYFFNNINASYRGDKSPIFINLISD
jgi:hypothetical protein